MARTYGATKNCAGCRFWSEMIAQALGGQPVEALCLAPQGSPLAGKYVAAHVTCTAWKSGHHGAVDEPSEGGYGAESCALYDREAEARHPNGAPMWNADGSMMLDADGNRSIFDDVDK